MLFYLLLLGAAAMMLYVVVTLVSGGFTMTRTDDGARERSNDWMWKRVGAQAIALLLLYLAFRVRNG
jgi:hypothetical protein